ncbi:uncharacterized protein [Aegilops tauschii subsp. strangulata]|uniref:uncharacterized protein isoform X2 n=1 Tax=Aegilops tauschii subsp. strangulata TaxID=200361 RepID=UPI00098BBF78|nr:uncharacterized protein LOC109759799 isoform X2 [Aegilops tauschii subsp. strangulata]
MATAAEDVEAFLATCASSGDAEDVEAFLATCAASGDAAYDAAKAMLERLDAPTKYADPFPRPPLLRSRHPAPSRSQRSTWMISKRWTSLRLVLYGLVEIKFNGDGGCQAYGIRFSVYFLRMACLVSSTKLTLQVLTSFQIWFLLTVTIKMILIARYIHLQNWFYLFLMLLLEKMKKKTCQILCSHINVFLFTAWISLAHHEIYTGYVPMDYRECLKKMPMNGEWGYHVMLQAATDLLQGWRRHSGLEMAGEAELPCATLSTKVAPRSYS